MSAELEALRQWLRGDLLAGGEWSHANTWFWLLLVVLAVVGFFGYAAWLTRSWVPVWVAFVVVASVAISALVQWVLS